MQSDLTDIEQQRRMLRERGICVVIPTYNNAGTIVDVVRRSKEQCDDVIVVCDGCTDDTVALLQQVDGITIVSCPHNGGKGIALKRGFQKALKEGFSYAITLDADGQHFPEDIHIFLEANIDHPEAIIVGQRKGMESVERTSGSKFANAFSNFWFCVQTGHRLADTQTGYRLYPLKKLPCLSLLTSRYEAELELMVFSSWQGVEIVSKEVNVFYPPKEKRVSHFRPIKDFSRIFVLNTCLSILAIVYAYPLKLFRLLMTILRTLYSLLLYLIACFCILLPYTALLNVLRCDKQQKAVSLRKLLYRLTRFVVFQHGIPGVRCTVDRGGETFDRPAVIICNHQSHLDLMLMLSQTPKMIVLTNDWVWNSPFFGKVLQNAEYYPVSMGIDSMLPKLKDLVERGYSIAVYPEGTRSKDCRIGRFHKGAFHIASALKLDILPFVEYGAGQVLPKGGKYLRRGDIRLQINKRIPYEEYTQYGTSQEIASRFRKYYRELRVKNYAL
ncbi:MAG: glycosyltransferase [Prevotella sp.]|nr:glycosyltransferase [Prevotella sp.]